MIDGGSEYIKKSFQSSSIEDMFNIKKSLASPVYKSIYYDPQNNVYYRFVKLGDEFANDRDFKSQSIYFKNNSVLIFNESFEIIGETKLPIDRYVLNMSLMTDEGLYISTSNPYSHSINENLMEFELFTINKN